MNENNQTSEEHVERLKRKYGIDGKIAAKHHVTEKQVEESFDPRLVKVLLQLVENRKKDGGQ
jgi:hypothetical protein